MLCAERKVEYSSQNVRTNVAREPWRSSMPIDDAGEKNVRWY